MAVIGTYCEICGLPVQLDHYVPMPGGGFWIWRDDDAGAAEPAITFGAEHAWLARAVAVCWDDPPAGTVIEGTVHDGYLESADGAEVGVSPDIDEWGAAHSACWRLAGQPASWESLGHPPRPAGLEKYQQQLFGFRELADDGFGWTLIDPDADTPDGARSRRRILGLLRPDPDRADAEPGG